MNKYTVALCYWSGIDLVFLEKVRKSLASFGQRTECLLDTLSKEHHYFGRKISGLGRGYDLVVFVTDHTQRHDELALLGFFNHTLSDPWATCVVTTQSPSWKSPQPTVAIESERYLGYVSAQNLPNDFLDLLRVHRKSLHDRGLSKSEWSSIRRYATPDEWANIMAMRNR